MNTGNNNVTSIKENFNKIQGGLKTLSQAKRIGWNGKRRNTSV